MRLLYFQVWIYETFNNLGTWVHKKSSAIDTIPRIVRWSQLEQPTWADADRILSASPVRNFHKYPFKF